MAAHPWNRLIATLPEPHLLQSWEWGQVKSHYGWQPAQLFWQSSGSCIIFRAETKITHPTAAALLLQRTIPAGGFAARMRILYIPKGPSLDWSDPLLRARVLDDLQVEAKRRGALLLKIDPDIPLGQGVPGEPGSREHPLGLAMQADLQRRGWRYSKEQIQFRNTVLVDLCGSEEDLLRRMKQKTRYNIRLAERKGVAVRVATPEDLGLLYHMYAETSLRDGFVIRDEGYYRRVWAAFLANRSETPGRDSAPLAEPLIAEVDGEAVAAVIVFRFCGKAWYLYGMSRNLHREKMPNYLLQWEAMRRAKAAGCSVYDLWGAPEVFNESDPLWGVFRFKLGLGGVVQRTIGAWDLPIRPRLYRLYTHILPRLLAIMRRRGQTRTQQSTGL